APWSRNGISEKAIHLPTRQWMTGVVRGRLVVGSGGIRRNPNDSPSACHELGNSEAGFMDLTANDSTTNEIARRFRHDLGELRLRAGQPSYSALEKTSKHELKRATVSDHLNGKRTGLPDWPFVFALVRACRAAAEANGLDLDDLGTVADWKQHWDAAKRGIVDVRFPGRARQQAHLGHPSKAERATADILDEQRQQHRMVTDRESQTIWGSVPPPINHFVGRTGYLDDLHSVFTQDGRTGALAIQGVAGIGKTQLAAEYARRYRFEYDLVWWISCTTQDAARRGMSELAFRLGATEASRASGDNKFTAVFDMLRLSRRYARWLLVFDGANDPEDIRKLIPPDRQNVLITSRNYRWKATDTLLELDPLKREESVELLRERRRNLSEAEAHQLADALGDLPLALEHAAESPFEVAEYIDRLETDAIGLFSGSPPSAYPYTIADVWETTIRELLETASDAMALLVCLAFFGSEPIPRESIDQREPNQTVSLHNILRDPVRFYVAILALGRMGLLSNRLSLRTGTSAFHVHKLTQCIVRGRLSIEEQRESRRNVQLLLPAADPANPEDSDRWGQYEELRGHIDASDAVGSQDQRVRFLIVNFVRYQCAAGDPKQALRRADDALKRWAGGTSIEELSPEDVVLAMYRAKAEVLCCLGMFNDAFEVGHRTLGKMRSATQKWPEEIAALSRIAGIRLRIEGDFASALAVDIHSKEEHIAALGSYHPQTFMAMQNLCVDYSLNGEHAKAHEIA